MEQMKEFLEKLKESRLELIKKRGFMAEHNFVKEQEFVQDKLNVIEPIIWELESVVEGTKKANQVQFNF